VAFLELRTTNRGPRAFFTDAGLAALLQLVLDRRVMDPVRFGHLRRELGLEEPEGEGGDRPFLKVSRPENCRRCGSEDPICFALAAFR
jgi:hypothetical protein